YLASKPSGWVVRNSEFEKHFDKGKDFIKQKLAYLREIDDLQTSKIRDEAGKIVRHETIVKKMFSSIGVKIQPLESHTLGNAADGESAPIKERYIEKKDNINTLSLTLSHPEKKEIEREREKLKPIEYQESLKALEYYPLLKAQLLNTPVTPSVTPSDTDGHLLGDSQCHPKDLEEKNLKFINTEEKEKTPNQLKPIEYQETLYAQNNELEEYKDSKELSEKT